MTGENVRAEGAKPTRAIAILLGVVGPWGIGQFYLGQRKRAVLWLVLPSAFVILCALSLPLLGSVLGYRLVFGALFVGVLGAWLGSLVDLHLIPETRLRKVGGLKVVGYWAAGVAFTMAVRLPLRNLVIEAFKIPSGGMQPALLVGDHIMADKLVLRTRTPKRGEAIIFKFPERPEQDFVKRVIAVPGDHLEVKSGHPWLNGWEVPHCLVGNATTTDSEGNTSSGELYVEYLDGEAYLTFLDEHGGPMSETQGPYAVDDNEVWVLGDNRNSSHDSRFWFGGRGGGVPLDHVKARALFRWISVTDAGIDWSRFGTSLAVPLLPVSMNALQGALTNCLGQRPPPDKTVPPVAR